MAKELEMRESPAGMSMFGTFQSCLRKGAFKYVLGYTRSGIKPEPLVHGSAIHEGKKVFYGTHSLDKAIERAIEIAVADPESFKSIEIEKERIALIFAEWFKVYGEEDLTKYRIITNEQEEIIKLANGAELTLRIDQVMQDIKTGHIFIFDTKTTGWSLEGTISEYEFKPQPLLYVASVYRSNPAWLADFRGWVTDVIYNRVNFKRNGELSSISTKCQRSSPIMYTEAECESFLESLISVTSEIKWATEQFKEGKPFNACFPMNRGACRAFGRTCPYWPICFDDFEHDQAPPLPFEADPWKAEGVIDGVLAKISV